MYGLYGVTDLLSHLSYRLELIVKLSFIYITLFGIEYQIVRESGAKIYSKYYHAYSYITSRNQIGSLWGKWTKAASESYCTLKI